MELMGILNRHHVLNVLYHTDHRRITAWVRTDRTNLIIGNVMANLAILHIVFHTYDSIRKAIYVLSRLA